MVIKRLLQEKISKRITPGKVVIIYGARRVGKTVLLRELVNSFEGKTLLLNGEDYDVQSMLANRSVANYRHLFNGVELVAIDEAQNIPNIGSVLKLMVDEIDEVTDIYEFAFFQILKHACLELCVFAEVLCGNITPDCKEPCLERAFS